jgi:hypothetical protein
MQYPISALLNSVLATMDHTIQRDEGEEPMKPQEENQAEPVLPRTIRKQVAASLYFAHFKLGKGFATVACGKAATEGLTCWGVSFCCPADQFNRAEGRLRAKRNLFDNIGSQDVEDVHAASSTNSDLYLAAPHDACLMTLQRELVTRRPWWFKRNRDKIETISRPRAKKKMGNLKTTVVVNLAATVTPTKE